MIFDEIMVSLASVLLGGILGIGLWVYVEGFIERLQKDIYHNYAELFPQNPPHFQPHFAAIQGKKCGHFRDYFCFGGGLLFLLNIASNNPLFALWLSITLMLLWAIVWLDWQYQLISSMPCLCLVALGFWGADQGFSALTLEESLQSAVGFFLIFYGIYWLAKWHYKKEALGSGDYWLALGIGSYLPLERLPLFLLIACLLGIAFALIFRQRKDFLPFAPFLCSSTFVVWLLDYYA